MAIDIEVTSNPTPLYLRTYDPLQIMDLPTAIHSLDIAQKDGLERIPIWKIVPEFQPVDRKTAQKYIPDISWYADQEHAQAIHGQWHSWRVYFNVEIFGQLKNLDESQMNILRATATIHDLQRTNDIFDKDHGRKSAEWFAQNYHLLEGRGIFLTESERQAVVILSTYHDVDYEEVPSEIKTQYGPLLKIFMASDAGDRYRAPDPQWWPNEKFTHDDEDTKMLWQFDQYFTLMSQYIQTALDCSGEDAIDAVAVDLGILQDKERTNTTVTNPRFPRRTSTH